MNWTMPYPCRLRSDSVRRINMSSEPGNESFLCALRPIPRILSLRRAITRVKFKASFSRARPRRLRSPIRFVPRQHPAGCGHRHLLSTLSRVSKRLRVSSSVPASGTKGASRSWGDLEGALLGTETPRAIDWRRSIRRDGHTAGIAKALQNVASRSAAPTDHVTRAYVLDSASPGEVPILHRGHT